MVKPNFLRTQFQELPDDALEQRYLRTDQMIQEVTTNLGDETGMPDSSKEELVASREKLLRELAVLSVLLEERGI